MLLIGFLGLPRMPSMTHAWSAPGIFSGSRAEDFTKFWYAGILFFAAMVTVAAAQVLKPLRRFKGDDA